MRYLFHSPNWPRFSVECQSRARVWGGGAATCCQVHTEPVPVEGSPEASYTLSCTRPGAGNFPPWLCCAEQRCRLLCAQRWPWRCPGHTQRLWSRSKSKDRIPNASSSVQDEDSWECTWVLRHGLDHSWCQGAGMSDSPALVRSSVRSLGVGARTVVRQCNEDPWGSAGERRAFQPVPVLGSGTEQEEAA